MNGMLNMHIKKKVNYINKIDFEQLLKMTIQRSILKKRAKIPRKSKKNMMKTKLHFKNHEIKTY